MMDLFRYTDASWEESRGWLRLDLDHIQTAFNQLVDQTFTVNGTLSHEVFDISGIPGDSTTPTRYVANTGPLGAPKWDQVELTNGVKGTLPFTNLPTLPASRLAGRGSAAGAGVIEPISLGSGLTLTGTVLSAAAVSALSYVPLATGAEPMVFLSDGAGSPILVPFTP